MSGIDQVIADIASILDSVACVGVQPETPAGAVTIAEVETGNRNSCKKLIKFSVIWALTFSRTPTHLL